MNFFKKYDDEVIYTVLCNRLMAIATVESLIAEQHVEWLEEQGRDDEAYAEERLPLPTTYIFRTLRDVTILKNRSDDLIDCNCELWLAIDSHDNMFSDMIWRAKNRLMVDVDGELPDDVESKLENAYFECIRLDPYWGLAAIPTIEKHNNIKLVGPVSDFASGGPWNLFNHAVLIPLLDALHIKLDFD